MGKMPPKKRDKEKDAETSKAIRQESSNDDHEQFLQAFEKPTQIYRYLRTRNMLKPIFLYRTLSYMKHRMSRSNKTTRGFKVDSLLDKVLSRIHQEQHLSGFLTLTFLGFYNKTELRIWSFQGISQEDPVKVETLLLKICHKKRKDVSCPVMTVSLGTSYVAYNPSADYPPPKAPTVSISTESFSLGGHLVKSYHLLLRVNTISSLSDSISTGDQLQKKRKLSCDEDKVFGTDLVIYDKQNRCLLTDGEYDFFLEEIQPGTKIAHTLSTWEDIDHELKEEAMNERTLEAPILKVRLQWSKEAVTPVVDYPPPLSKSHLNNIDILQNNNNNDRRVKLEETTSVVYQFLYNNNSKQQTEASYDMHCPWCSIDCKTLYSLLKHLKLCHPRFTFTLVVSGGGARIDVSLNEGYDGSYCGVPGGGGVAAGRGAGPAKRTPLSHIIVCHPKRPSPNLSEFLHNDENDFETQRPYITGHNRVYHHTTTCLPVSAKEMDIDSEDENDPKWLQKKTQMMIDEFTDVNEGEKELMKMWNLHVMKHGFVGDCQIPLACSMFLEQRGEELLTKNLYRNFVAHMCNLFDFGLVSPVMIYTSIQKLQEMIIARPDAIKIVKDSCEGHKEQWKETLARQLSPNCVPPEREQRPETSGVASNTPGQRRKPNINQQQWNPAQSVPQTKQKDITNNCNQDRENEDDKDNRSSASMKDDKKPTRRRLSLQPQSDSRRKLPARRKSFNNN